MLQQRSGQLPLILAQPKPVSAPQSSHLLSHSTAASNIAHPLSSAAEGIRLRARGKPLNSSSEGGAHNSAKGW
eukprot:3222267-Rhodomonas_salina.1